MRVGRMKDLQAIINNRSAELKDRVFHEVTRRYEKQPRSSSTKAGTFQQMKATGKKTMSREEAEAASEQHKSGREARFGKQDRTEAVIQEQTSEFLQGKQPARRFSKCNMERESSVLTGSQSASSQHWQTKGCHRTR